MRLSIVFVLVCIITVPTARAQCPAEKMTKNLVTIETDLRFLPSFSPDGTTFLLKSDQDTLGEYHYYATPLDGGAIKKLTPDNARPAFFGGANYTPDSQRIVYKTRREDPQGQAQYTGNGLAIIPATGGAATTLDQGDFFETVGVNSFDLTADGTHAVYTWSESSFFDLNMYSVHLDNLTRIRLDHDGGTLRQREVLADSQTIVYGMSIDVGGAIERYQELWRVNMDGSMRTRIVGNLQTFTDIKYFFVTPDGAHILFTGDLDINDKIELYTVPLAGGSVVKINGQLPINGTVNDGIVWITPDSQRVVYAATQRTSENFELFSAPVDGSAAAVPLTQELPFDNDAFGPQLTPDGQHILYLASLKYTYVPILYASPVDGSTAPVALTPDPEVDGFKYSNAVRISPDGTRVACLVRESYTSRDQLYVAEIDGSPVGRIISPPLPEDKPDSDYSTGYVWTPDSNAIIIGADPDTESQFEAYRIEADGSGIQKISDVLPSDGSLYLSNLYIPENSNRFVYRADARINEVDEWYTVDIDGCAISVSLEYNGPDPDTMFPIVFDVEFSAPVTNFDNNDGDDIDVVFEGSAGVTAYTVTGSGTTYTVEVTGASGDGDITATVPAGVVTGVLDGAPNLASVSAKNTVTAVIGGRPTVDFFQPLPPLINNGTNFVFEIDFNEGVQNVDEADFEFFEKSGPRPGMGSSFTSLRVEDVTLNQIKRLYEVTGSSRGGSGQVGLRLAAGTDITDNNGNPVLPWIGNEYITIDRDKPKPTVQAGPPRKGFPFHTQIIFDEPVKDFAQGDITVTNGSITIFAGEDDEYGIGLAPDGPGDMTVTVAVGVCSDFAGNGNSTSNTLTVMTGDDALHSADQDGDNDIDFAELLRVIQLFNAGDFGCDSETEKTEDGYLPNGIDTTCAYHAGDYDPEDWTISLTELLRQVQIFNTGGYTACLEANPATEDGYCPS